MMIKVVSITALHQFQNFRSNKRVVYIGCIQGRSTTVGHFYINYTRYHHHHHHNHGTIIFIRPVIFSQISIFK